MTRKRTQPSRRIARVFVFGVLAFAITVFAAGFGTRPAQATHNILQVASGTLACGSVITFDDVAGGAPPGTNHDAVFASVGAQFAERFVGQTRSTSGDHDVLSGSPTNPLTLQVGDSNDNVNVIFNLTSQVVDGLGPLGFPNFDAIGEGSIATFFSLDQSQLGFDIVGGDFGSATLNFFRSDGSLIETIVVPNITSAFLEFQRVGGINDIAGVSIHNDDDAGIGYDNFCIDIALDLRIAKTLLEGPEEIGIHLLETTQYVFEISYSGPDALIVDTVPAEFEIIGCDASDGSVDVFDTSRGRVNSANRIEWTVPDGASTLECTIQTIASPGGGHKEGTVYRPTSCGPLPINDGATAFEIDPATGEVVREEVVDPATGLTSLVPVVLVGPSNNLVVEAVEGTKPCEEVLNGVTTQESSAALDPFAP